MTFTTFFELANLQKGLYVVVLALIILGISLFIETYKKIIRKSKCSKYEIWGVGLLLSVLATLLVVFSGIFHPIFVYIGSKVWFDCVLLTLGIFIAQFQADMKLVKKLIKTFVKVFLKNSGLNDEQIDMILGIVEKPVNPEE